MSSSLPPLPRDIDELTRLVRAEKAENERLRERIALLERLIFGAKSEKSVSLLAEQGLLDLGDLTAVAGTPKAEGGKRRGGGKATRQEAAGSGAKTNETLPVVAQAIDDRPWRGPAPPAVGYVFAESRGTGEVEDQLKSFGGILQVDGYGAYEALVKRRRKSNAGPLRLAFCLAHARRKFVEVVKSTGSPEALAVIAVIAEIYRIEERIRGRTAEERLEVRRAESAPIMDALKRRLADAMAEVSAKSSLGKAIAYMLGHWSGLIAFLDDGRIEVDSNVVERSTKSVALTRKNALFVGNARGGETWAILAALINAAELNGVDPQAWLTDVLERIVSEEITVDRLDELLPWVWKAAKAGASTKEAA